MASVVFTFTSAPALAQVVPLNVLEQRALETHVALATSDAQARAARTEIRKARIPYYPTVSLTADSTLAPGRQLIQIRDPDTGKEYRVQGAPTLGDDNAFVPQFRNGLTLEAKAGIYDFGRTASAVEASEQGHRAALANTDRTREEVVHGVRDAYVAWLTAYEMHRLATQAVEDQEAELKRVTALVEQNARPRTELSPAQAEALVTKLEREQARADLDDARVVLEQAVGEALPREAQPDLSLLSADAGVGPSSAQDDAALRTLNAQRAAANALARMHQRSRAPQLGASVSAGVRQQADNVFPLYGVGLSLTVPLWDGGLATAQAESARAQADELGARLVAAQQQRLQERERAQVEIANANARVELAEQLLATGQERLREMQAAYELNAVGLEHVNQARALLRRAHSEILLAKATRSRALLRLAPTKR